MTEPMTDARLDEIEEARVRLVFDGPPESGRFVEAEELISEIRRLREENERMRAEAGKLERERNASIAVCEGLSRTQGCPPMPPGAIVSRFTITPEMLAAHAEWLRTKDTKTPSGTRIVVPPGVDLRGANLRGANLGGANLRGANLGGADLRGADLGGANLRGANLGGANLRCANLGGANLRCANLGGTDLGGAYLRGADLACADLGGADLGCANLRDANLGDAYLRGADLRGAYLAGADLGDAYLHGADLLGADLGGIAVGHIGRYEWMSWREKDGTRVLRFGCETHPLSEWAQMCEALAEKHERDEREFYARATRALVAMCDVERLEGGEGRERE